MPTTAELGQKVKAKYPGEYDDMPDVLLGQQMKAKFPGDYDDFSDTPQPGDNTIGNADPVRQGLKGLGQAATMAGRMATNALPLAGGMIGGAVGAPAGPMGIAGGAGLGAMGGEAWRQNINRMTGAQAPQDGGDAVGRMNMAGIEGAASTIAANQALRASQAVGRVTMAKALKPAKGLVANFRTVVRDAIAQGARVGSVGRGPGSAETAAVRRQASNVVSQILDRAAQQGIMLDRHELAQPMIEAVETRLRRPLSPEEYAMVVRQVSQRAGRLLTSASAGIRRHAVQGDPVLYNELRRLARDEAKARGSCGPI